MRAFVAGMLMVTAVTVGIADARAATASRNFTVTGFDRIRVEGPYAVVLQTGRGSSARATGDARALDRLSVEVQGTTLVVRADRSGWSGWPGEAATGGVELRLTTPQLSAAMLNGSGDVTIDKVAAARFDLSVAGAGDVTIGRIEADRLSLAITGAGKVMLAGKAAQARVTVQGSGTVEAGNLIAQDVDVNVQGSGNVALAAARSAKVRAMGSGTIVIGGKPACAVDNLGSGRVTCGGK